MPVLVGDGASRSDDSLSFYNLFLFLFPSLFRSLPVLFLSNLFAIFNTGIPHISGQGGGQKIKALRVPFQA